MSSKKKHHKHNKQVKHHTQSSHSHDTRREHDRQARTHNADVYATNSGTGGGGVGVSRNARLVLVGIAALLVVSLTLMFVAGWIEW